MAMRERMLDEQRQALARERDMYTEAVLRLGREVSAARGTLRRTVSAVFCQPSAVSCQATL